MPDKRTVNLSGNVRGAREPVLKLFESSMTINHWVLQSKDLNGNELWLLTRRMENGDLPASSDLFYFTAHPPPQQRTQ
jgi:hypothetical protein